jgi:hypothetical protein
MSTIIQIADRYLIIDENIFYIIRAVLRLRRASLLIGLNRRTDKLKNQKPGNTKYAGLFVHQIIAMLLVRIPLWISLLPTPCIGAHIIEIEFHTPV